MIVDLFAGAGGWDCAARQIGMPDPIGYENDPDACATRRAADMPTVETDISTVTPPGDIEGLIASPPCQSFSSAGKRTGLADDRGQLVWLPLEWAKATMPTWCAWEQVPEVLPIWRKCATALRSLGYSVWTGCLDSERYGVPQTRTRAILMAHRERPMTPPAPTHQKYQHDVPQGDPHACGLDNMFDAGVKPWVSMAEALGWPDDGTLIDCRQQPTALHSIGAPARSISSQSASQWVFLESDRGPLTVEQAAALQTFPADHPWQGSNTAKQKQIGNAIPPMLAEAVLRAVIGA
jgi:DNA (cytosine-5)-methyltransferase 1